MENGGRSNLRFLTADCELRHGKTSNVELFGKKKPKAEGTEPLIFAHQR
jgi:hypothetical protein